MTRATPPPTGEEIAVLIASPLEPEHIERIAQVDPRIRILHDPGLIPTPTYQADHKGIHPVLTPDQERRWAAMLKQADVSFDFDWREPERLAENAPNLAWVQGTSAGIGQFLERTGLASSSIPFTTAAGVHAIPLAEFALLGLLHFVKEVPALREAQAAHRWQRYTARQLAGSRVAVVGLGKVGSRLALVLSALGVEVVGVGRRTEPSSRENLADYVSFDAIEGALPELDAIVLCCPLTPETFHLLDERRLSLLRQGAIIVNIGRGALIDEEAMVSGLDSGHLGGAWLDTVEVEPLSETSPLWDRDDVLISPHSASTVADENRLITDIFIDNLRRWIAGEELRNRYRPEVGY